MKRVILGALAVVLFTSAFSILARTEYLGFATKEFKNKVVLDKSIKVLNFTAEKHLDTIVSIGVSELEIKNITVVITSLNEEELEEEALMGYIENQETYYLIKLRPGLSRDYYLDICAHELIHLYQMENGYLKRLYYGFWYLGKVYTPYDFYWEREFEIEAFENELFLKLAILDKISNPPLSN